MYLFPTRKTTAALAAMLLWLVILPVSASASPLQIQVHADGKVGLGGEMQFAIELRNTSKRAIDFPAQPGWDGEGGLVMRITSADGKARLLPVEESSTDRSMARKAGSTVTRLEAGHAIVLYRSVKVSEEFKDPSSYRVIVSYRDGAGLEASSEPVEVSLSR